MELSRSRLLCQEAMLDTDNRLIMKPNTINNQYNGNMFQFENQDNCAFVVLPKHDYEAIKNDLMNVKQSLNEVKNYVSFEIQQLKRETTDMLKQVERCKCDQQQADLMMKKLHYNNSLNTSTPSSVQPPIWTSTDNSWDNTKPLFSSPDGSQLRLEGSDLSDTSHLNGSSLLNTPKMEVMNQSMDNKQIQLLANYDIYVNKLNLQIVVNEGISHKDNGALYVLRRLIPLVFSWEELAYSRGQGLNCKSTEDISNKLPLDPTKVLACKAYMRKFCLESGCPEPSERAINQTFSHQVNYARRRIRDAKEPKKYSPKKPMKRGRKPKEPKDASEEMTFDEHYNDNCSN